MCIYSFLSFKDTNKREKCKRKTRFSFHFRTGVSSTIVNDTIKRAEYKINPVYFVKFLAIKIKYEH